MAWNFTDVCQGICILEVHELNTVCISRGMWTPHMVREVGGSAAAHKSGATLAQAMLNVHDGLKEA